MRKPKRSEFFDLRSLRRLYGRSQEGNNREVIKTTMTPQTVNMLRKSVPYGKGGYGASVIELGTRVVVALVSNGEEVEAVAKELFNAADSPYLLNNCKFFLNLIQEYERIGADKLADVVE